MRQTVDLIGCIGFAALAVAIVLGWMGLVRLARQMRRLS